MFSNLENRRWREYDRILYLRQELHLYSLIWMNRILAHRKDIHQDSFSKSKILNSLHSINILVILLRRDNFSSILWKIVYTPFHTILHRNHAYNEKICLRFDPCNHSTIHFQSHSIWKCYSQYLDSQSLPNRDK